MDYDARGFVSTPHGRVFYGVRGSGPPMILLDGIGCDGFAWKYLQPQFSRTHRTIHWHYPGHGRSGPPANPYEVGIPTLGRVLADLMDHLEVPSATLIGHSMGTQVALEFYRWFSERVNHLVLMCGTYGKVTHTFHDTDLLYQVLPTLIQTVKRHRGFARALWGRVPGSLAYRVATLSHEIDALAVSKEDFCQYWDHVSGMDPDVFLATLHLAGEHSAEDILPSIRVPTLVIAAERDTFTPPRIARSMAQTIPSAQFVLLRGATHAAPVEQAGTVQQTIYSFLNGTPTIARDARTVQ